MTPAPPPAPIRLPVEGLTCASCVGRVERALSALPGVTEAQVNLATGQATIHTDATAPLPTLIEAIEAAGFGVPPSQIDLEVEGMTCASCVGRLERALSALPGVTGAQVNLATQGARVQGHLDAQALIQAATAAGYPARVAATVARDRGAKDQKQAAELLALRRDFALAAALTLPIFLLEMTGHLFPPFHAWVARTLGMQTSWVIQGILTTLVLFGPGRRFYLKGLPALFRGAPEMNSLVALGSLAAYAFSLIATFAPTLLPPGTVHVYYEAAAVIVTLILLGRLFEARAKGRTSEAIRHLLDLQPKVARVRTGGGVLEVPLGQVRPGDEVEVIPGQSVPVDGTLIEGRSEVDESMITGEPMPVLKTPGSPVVAGTLNQQGSFVFRATGVGEDTMLAKIIQMVEQAQGSKLPVQQVLDRVTMWFVPLVMGLATLSFALWFWLGPAPSLTYALVSAVTVLIVACPCAMGLATPTSIMVGTGRAAEMGILFRNGQALQALQGVKAIALDKTGTLTEGRPKLTDLEVAPGFERDTVLLWLAAVEAKSEHPVARAIVKAAGAQGIATVEALDFESIPGQGVRATVQGRQVQVGARHLMEDLGLDPAAFDPQAQRLAREGKTPFYVAIDGQLAAIVAVADPIKPTTPEAIAQLRTLGLTIVMITGDDARTARVVGGALGIDDIVAQVLPQGKIEAIKRLKDTHGTVAFVGDGINDAPALAEADVGVAIGTGTDIAIAAADLVLLSGSLAPVAEAIALSRATLRNIKQNLFWAFAYNILLLPIAAGALWPTHRLLLSPMLAAAAMACSSVFVLLNALRLRTFKKQAL